MESQLDQVIAEQNAIADHREIQRCKKCYWKHIKESGSDGSGWCYMFAELFSGCMQFKPAEAPTND